jgi:alpha-tubulin suppressor-like RCC1 family protein
MTTQITANNITNNTITVTQLVPGALSPKIKTISICDSSFNVLDDTAANTTGGFIQITGSTFGANSQVIIGTNNATSVTFVNTSTLRAQVPAAAATSYPVYVIDTDTGATAIKINGLTHSSFPAWSTGATLSNQTANTSFAVNLSANSDSNITYSNTTALPAGTTLAANGYFSGTVSIGSQTTYSFDVKATDAELQDSSRTFSLTVTVTPPYYLYSWGRNADGGLGLNNIVSRSSPTQVGTDSSWLSISGGDTTVAIKTNGTLWALGGVAGLGALGLNDQINRSSPVQIGSLTNWSLLSNSNYAASFYAIKNDGTLWAWGYNGTDFGNLGLNDNFNKSSPTQVGTDTNWSSVATQYVFGAAIKTNGTLWMWGRNQQGQLGQNNRVYRSSPTQVGTETSWQQVILGSNQALAIKTNGTLWAWGQNSFGQHGSNNTIVRSSPVQIGTDTNWSKLTPGQNFVLAFKTNGTLWAWGRNDYLPALGLGDSINRSSPVQIGSGTTWLNAAAGKYHVIATKTDGTLWGWGDNTHGMLGLGNNTNYNSPKQIGSGTTWLNPSVGNYSSMATRST